MSCKLVCSAAGVMLATAAVVAVSGAGDPPAGGSAEVFERHCSMCHPATIPLEHCRNWKQWQETIAKMSEFLLRMTGNEIPDDVRGTIACHLEKHAG